MKASEVFDLPVASGERFHDGDDIFQAGGEGEWCATFCSDEQAKVAANCINHADALADALDAALLQMHYFRERFGEIEFSDSVSARGNEALEAYRGEK